MPNEAATSPSVVGLRRYVEAHNTTTQATYERLGLHAAGDVVIEALKTSV